MSKPKKNFEFLLTIDNSIIIQRFFKIDVINDIDYEELNYCVIEICEDIIKVLNEKSSYYKNQLHSFHIKTIGTQTKYDYQLEIIKIDDNSVISQVIFSGGFYYPKIRYNVNIKNETKEYIGKIKQILEK